MTFSFFYDIAHYPLMCDPHPAESLPPPLSQL